MSEKILVDGHVHLYDCADRLRFAEATARNLARAVPAGVSHWQGCLLLTETARDTAFQNLREADLCGGLKIKTIPDDPAALSLNWNGSALMLIAGRQVVTAEGLEVLALATARQFDDGQPIAALLAQLRAEGIPAVLPWGLGKWLGRRGRVVADLVQDQPGLLLGDNAGRPPGWSVPLFRRGLPVLPGTDPLPLPGAEEGVGQYGFMLDGRLDPQRPAVDMARRLMALRAQPQTFGHRRSFGTILGEQVALRRAKPAPGAMAA